MAYPVGYTQAANGYWYKDSDASGPYALGPTGALFLVGDGVVGSGSFTQGKNGFWYAADGDNSGPYALGPDGLFYLLGGSGGMPITDLELIIPGSSPQEELVLSANADGALVLTPTDYANTEITGLSIPHYLNTPTNFAFLELMADGDVATLEVKTGGTPPTLNLAVTAQSLYGTARIAAFSGGVIEAYNLGVPGDANYERLRMDWSSNVARIWTQNDGSGSARSLRVGAASADGATAPVAYTQWNNGALPVIQHTLTSGAPNTGTWSELASTGTGLSAASGTQTAVAISPTFAQTSTAAGIALLVNPSGTFGSGGGKLQSWQLASSEVGAMTSSGAMYAGSFRTLLDFGFAATVGGSTDLTLIRDAADTLAQRRTTNAQTFRVYNTYTDASNYERLAMVWSGSNAFLLVENAGTGSARDLTVGTGGSANFNIRTANTGRWQVNPSGHFLAVTDNTYDIGASGATRPRNLYVGSSVIVGLNASIDGVANIGIAQSSSTTLNIAPSITTRSSLRLTAGVAPTSPVDGDMWRVGAQLFLRDGGTTKSVTFA